jgi:RimJ/RimL family protein N-acetyltransferase
MPDGWPGTEVGWGIIRDCWGRGYAVEGATAAIDWAFDELGWSEVIHAIDPTNGASWAVARKLGAELIGLGRLPAPIDTSAMPPGVVQITADIGTTICCCAQRCSRK